MGVFDGSIGAFVSGTLISTFLLGVTATQAFIYYQTFPKDRRIYWWTVTILLIMDWTHTAMSCYTVYDWTVTHYGDIAHLANSPWTFAVDPAMTGIVASIVQMFYAYRVYVVGKRRMFFPIVICVLSAVQLGFACGATGMIFKLQAFAKFQSWTYGVCVWLVCAAAADLIITGSLVYFLQRSKENILQTTSVCDKLIELVIQSNGLTAAVAVIDAVLFSTLSTSYHVTANLCLVKLYFNSLLVSLNARADLERQLMNNQRSGSHNFGHGTPTLMTASGFNLQDIKALSYKSGGGPGNVLVSTSQTVTSEIMSKEDYEKFSSPNPGPKAGDMRRKESDQSLDSSATHV
ncbi:hypothetical protein T439DRAFT_324653 [Meredithblackwellia eburnea MCA 4105]